VSDRVTELVQRRWPGFQAVLRQLPERKYFTLAEVIEEINKVSRQMTRGFDQRGPRSS
jgi:hypothetical protein